MASNMARSMRRPLSVLWRSTSAASTAQDPNSPATTSAIDSPMRVGGPSGEPVTAMFVHGGLTITAMAVPLEPGALGDMVRLRNPDSGKVFSGIVLADGTVRLGR